ncbi:MAG: adenylate/guanylate cyclase domain-containing protein [Aquisalimonadaceae bacterium]
MSSNGEQRRVLMVDGLPASVAVARAILEPDGHAVIVAESGRAALELARRDTFDAFLLDLEDASMDGVELCRLVRAEPGYYLTPLLAATESEDRELWRRAYAAGCDDVLRKPLEPIVLEARLKNLMEKTLYAQELERVRANLARYVSPRIRQILQAVAPGQGLPAPEEQRACILFSDIRGFTAMAQSIPAETLFATVSRQLGAQVESVYAHGGYVDKFGGDGIMAVFDGENMARNACACALEIMQSSREMSGEDGPELIPLGIGIHVGPVMAGNIGTGEHLDYTVIGNTVNLAARLCGYAQPMDIVVSDAVREALGEVEGMTCSDPRYAKIRGLSGEVTLFRLDRPSRAVAG